ncbi:SDR family oxidoreductase [Christiangramia sabulilitoris]|uniref:NAD-dependent epimerase/dehydratase family protein n=1 Tax=Christiangramia sabulilitoris TaxID=2583991 RepID=A0A550HZD5_9FLAO|nr:NAD(P)H-binding protein [Christiangramia sabulilitoris]TRO64060.1 NAD-dependent epimerase/dehydratase family protein [Christiangramia sabulilitoris]
MKKILIAGASGVLGMEITKALYREGHHLRLHTSSEEKRKKLSFYSDDIHIATEKDSFKNITKNIDIVISALGNSISLFTKNENSFFEIDFEINRRILQDAKVNSVQRFIYVSIKGAGDKANLNIPGSNRQFEKSLQNSGINHTILRPVGLFSGLHDLAIMAKRNFIPVIGDGLAKTNSIHQADLAEVAKKYLFDGPEILEIGGPEIHTRLEMAEMIKDRFNAEIIRLPESLAEIGIAMSKISGDIHSKLENFKYITTHDMIGEKYGSRNFKQYLQELDNKDLP